MKNPTYTEKKYRDNANRNRFYVKLYTSINYFHTHKDTCRVNEHIVMKIRILKGYQIFKMVSKSYLMDIRYIYENQLSKKHTFLIILAEKVEET